MRIRAAPTPPSLPTLCGAPQPPVSEQLLFSPHGAQAELLKTLRQRHREGIPAAANPPASPDIRTIEQKARRIDEVRQQNRIRDTENAHVEFAEAVWKHHDTLMTRVDQLVAEKNTKSYDTAVRILNAIRQACRNDHDLRHLHQKTLTLRTAHPRLVGLRHRLEQAGLCEGIPGRSESSFLTLPNEPHEHLDWTILDL